MSNPSESVAELQRLRQRVRELESQLISEANLLPGDELPDIVLRSSMQESEVFLTLLDRQGRLMYFSHTDDTHAQVELIGKSIFDFVPPEYHQALRNAIDRVFNEGAREYIEAESVHGGWYCNRFSPIKLHGEVLAVCNFSECITSRRQVEQQLRDSEASWRSLAESVPDSVVLFDLHGQLQYANRLQNLTLEQAQQMKPTDFVQPQYRDAVTQSFEQVCWTGKPVEIEVQDAVEGLWYLARLGPVVNNGKVVGVVSIARNISERKEAEQRIHSAKDELEVRVNDRTTELNKANQSLLAERRVLQRLLDLHDRDRQLIAYEIHDGLVQDMTGALLYFESASEAIKQVGGKAANNYAHGAHLIRSSIQEARRLINGLRPTALEDLGLIEALANFVEELRTSHDIDIQFEHDVKFVRLAPVVERAIFRIVHEALTNLARHSGTSQAFVSIHQPDAHVNIVVKDWGRGYDPKTVKPKRFGLISIQERARLLGGESSIETEIGVGTTVKVQLPVTDVLLPGAPIAGH